MTTDAFSPESLARSRRVLRILLWAGVVAVVVTIAGLWLAGRSWSHGLLDDYDRAAREWDAGFGSSIVQGTAEVPESAFVTSKVTSFEAEATQRRGCGEVEGILRNLRQGSEQVPTVDAGVAGWFSSDLRAADRSSHERRAAVRAYAAKAIDVFEQVHVDCEWNADLNAPSAAQARINRLFAQAKKYIEPQGTVSGPYQCFAAEGCVSASKDRRVKQASLQRQALLLQRKEVLKSYGASCRKTSYGPEVCRELAAAARGTIDAGLRAARLLGSLDRPDDPRINQTGPDLAKAARASKARARAVIKKGHPEAWRVKEIRKRYDVSSVVLRFETRRLVATLQKDRKALARQIDVEADGEQSV